MLFSDTYYEIQNDAESSLREKGSRFLAYSFDVKSELQVKEKLHLLKSKYPDATHHCYAFVLGQGSEAQRFNDDGEPSGSAGRPILRAILSMGLTNVLVVVVRYFGGTLLGIPGLIEAYGGAAKLVLSESGKLERVQEEQFTVSTSFEYEQEIHHLLRGFDARILDRQYTENITYTVAIRKTEVMQFESKAEKAYLLEVRVV
jgi:uncharacterized YigZ family protein